MSILSKLFKRRHTDKSRAIFELNIVDLEYSDLPKFQSGIDDIRDRKIDGFIIRNVISKENIERIVENYAKVPDEAKSEFDTGLITYPIPFAVANSLSENKESLEKYFSDSKKFWEHFEVNFGVDLVSKIKEALGKIAGGRTVDVPDGVNNIGMYNPATFKHLIPGRGEFKAHCGNYFHKEFPAFYKHMSELSVIKDQMSYFLMLSPSDKGGELTLYNVEWNDAEIREKNDTTLVDKKGNRLDLLDENSIGRIKLAPNPGDMIVFAGGQIWHKVEIAEGLSPRYTIGGFMTCSKDDSKLYIWS